MSNRKPPHIIVGAGLAGARAAQALRDEGCDESIVLIGTEPDHPYERPPLSKDYLQGKADRDSIKVHPDRWYADHDVELRLSTEVTGLDPVAHQVSLADGDRLRYSKLLLTTGSTPRRLTVPGADLDGVLSLRSVGDSGRIRDTLSRSARVAIIGAGWIGLEAAAAARAAGVDVTVLETASLPLSRVLGPQVAQSFADLHRAHGVDLRCGVQVAGLTGASGQVTGVLLGDGSLTEADAVIVGVGITPNTRLAEQARLDVDNGIRVDASLRSSHPDVYAAGDVANAFHPLLGKHIRVEHWANAVNQPVVAAQAMLGQDATYQRLPYFFTDQYDLGMEYVGYTEPGGYRDVVIRGDMGSGKFIAFWLAADRRVLAGMNVNTWDVNDAIRDLISTREPMDPARLADPGVALGELIDTVSARSR
ncbi:MAG: NAD(P)/FAD-dependent oxidoreductase [Propionibacteriaceae bacterium]